MNQWCFCELALAAGCRSVAAFLGWFSMNVYGEKNCSWSVGVFYTVLPVAFKLKVALAEGLLGNMGIKKIYTTP